MFASMLLLASATISGPVPVFDCGQPPRGTRPWVEDSDYPAEARRQRMGGEVKFSLVISKQGCPIKCNIVRSSGHKLLDEKTCELMMQRARFHPEGTPENPVETTIIKSMHWNP